MTASSGRGSRKLPNGATSAGSFFTYAICDINLYLYDRQQALSKDGDSMENGEDHVCILTGVWPFVGCEMC